MPCCQSGRTTITKHHRPDSLNNRIYFFIVLDFGSPNQSVKKFGFSEASLFGFHETKRKKKLMSQKKSINSILQ